MIRISYTAMVLFISVLWIFVRGMVCIKAKAFRWQRELELLLVYICLLVVARFTFFPFSKVDGRIQPLIFDAARVFPLRLNFVPLANLLDYEIRREAIINVVGNTAMFLPIGIIWPIVFRKLDSHQKVIAAGVGFSACIEILQLPFDRVTDIDDLLLNSLGFLAGYGICLLVRILRKK